MSEKRQREARERREAALERERAAHQRADRAAERGDDRATDSHRKAADAHRDAADAAETLRVKDVAIEASASASPRPALREPTPKRRHGGPAVTPPPDTAELDALIAEAVEHAAAVAQAAHDAAEMAIGIADQLAALLEERSRAHALDPAHEAHTADDAWLDAVPADVREVAVLEALAAGMSPADYLRDAVLSHSALSQDGAGGELHARLDAARRQAARLRAQSRAVQAQNAQVTRRQSKTSAAESPPSEPARRAANGPEVDPDRDER